MLASLLSLVALAGAFQVPADPPTEPNPTIDTRVDHSLFDNILRKNIRDDLVDYDNIRTNHLDELTAYLQHLASIKAELLPEKERIAFLVNAYNAAMIKAVVDRDDGKWRADANNFALFKEPLIEIGGSKVSLDDIEHGMLRKEFKEPRIHAALVCGARSCPSLAPFAYTGSDLDRQLDQRMRMWINDPTRNLIDRANKRLLLSRVFEWFADDFGGKDRLAEYVNRFAVGGGVEGFSVSFREYDWSLNKYRR